MAEHRYAVDADDSLQQKRRARKRGRGGENEIGAALHGREKGGRGGGGEDVARTRRNTTSMTSSADVRGTRCSLMYAMHAAILAAHSRVMVSPVLTYLEKNDNVCR